MTLRVISHKPLEEGLHDDRTTSIDPARFLHEQLAQASPDVMRDLLSAFIDALLSAEPDAVCGAGWGQPSPERVNRRNCYRHRGLDTV